MEDRADNSPKTRKRRGPVLSFSARKRKRKEQKQKANFGRISIGLEFERWKEVKEKHDLNTHAEVAKFLLDNYQKGEHRSHGDVLDPRVSQLRQDVGRALFAVPSTSTPAKPGKISTPLVSEISGASSDSDATLTAAEISASSTASRQQVFKSSRRKVTSTRQSSFVDPFNLSIDVSELIEDNEADEEDPDYEPSFEMTAVLPDEVNDLYEEVAYEEMEFAMETEEDDDVESVEEELGPGIKRVLTEEGVEPLIEATVCFAHVEQILSLAGTNVNKCLQADCQHPDSIRLIDEFIGSALYLKWICRSGHLVHRWCAQAVLNKRVNSVDFLASVATLTSGNNIGKLVMWAKHMNLKFVSSTTFHRIQRSYIVPTVDQYWAEKQTEVIEAFGDEELVLLGDGRNDSPGHSAQYCSYTLMEEKTKKIVSIQTLDKRTTDRKSANMEKAGFQLALEDARGKGIKVKELVTDAHLGIGAIMKKDHQDLKHSHDIWHAAKNLGKKIMKIAQKKENKVLIQWQRDIINHFWFTCSRANNYEEFLCIWRSLLHHITNQHSWTLSHGYGTNQCLHEPIDNEEDREKPWLCPRKDKQTLQNLASVILNKRLLNNVPYYLNFRSTAELEVFHQLILMYCAKRFAYSPPVYRIRNRLAAIDHNHHADRSLMKNKDGNAISSKSSSGSNTPERGPVSNVGTSGRGRGKRGAGRGRGRGQGKGRGRGKSIATTTRADEALHVLETRKERFMNALEDMPVDRMKELLAEAMEKNPSLILDVFEPPERQPGGFHPPEDENSPDWCVCGKCRDMPTQAERLCCKKVSCVSVMPDFRVLILDEAVLHLQRMYRRDVLVFDDEADIRKANRHAAYRQFVLWQQGRLGVGDRRVIPSCCVWAIRDRYPDAFGQYIGFLPSRLV